MDTITNREIAAMALEQLESGWIESRNGNYYLELPEGNLSVVYRGERKAWGFNAYIKDDWDITSPVLPRFQGKYETPLSAMIACRLWYEHQKEQQEQPK